MAPKHLTPSASVAQRQRRRELQRGYEKASYHRKKQTIASLNAEVERLQLELRQLALCFRPQDGDAATTDTMRRLCQLTEAAQALRDENALLKPEVDERRRLEARIRKLINDHQALTSVSHSFAFLPLPHDEYAEIIAKAQDLALRFFYDDKKLTTGSSVFGWRDYRTPAADGMFDYALEKEFTSMSAAEMEARTWQLLSSADAYASLYDRAMNFRAYLLEKINDDTYLYHSLIDPLPGVTANSVYLISRTTLDDGFLIVMCDVDHERICFRDLASFDSGGGTNTLWHRMCAWVVVQAKGPNRALFHHGGTNKIVFILEVLLVVLRWETKVVGPLMALPPCDNNI